jgi:hypothetical protein
LQYLLGSDKVSAVDCHTEFLAPIFANLTSALTWPRLRTAVAPAAPPTAGNPILLTPDDVRAMQQIVDDWAPGVLNCASNVHEIIYIALQRLQRDLDSGCEDEIIDDVQREIGYRLWCARHGL